MIGICAVFGDQHDALIDVLERKIELFGFLRCGRLAAEDLFHGAENDEREQQTD